MGNILVIGSLNVDFVTYVKQLPQKGETIKSDSFIINPGGKGANQAIAAAKLGGNVSIVGKVGSDEYGRVLKDNLKEVNVNTVGIETEGTTGMAFINVSSTGENQIVLVPGANDKITKQDINQIIAQIIDSDYIVMQFEIPLSIVTYVLDIAKIYGKKVIVNPAPAVEISMEDLQKADIIIPNETELAFLTKMQVETLDQIKLASKKLVSEGIPTIIVTMGEKGALIVEGEEVKHIPAIKVKAVDTTAAGDSYVAAFTVGKCKGMTNVEAATFANKVASITVTRKGAQSSLPTSNEVL